MILFLLSSKTFKGQYTNISNNNQITIVFSFMLAIAIYLCYLSFLDVI